ncbi:unnamed protein product [Linum trigynum]|uniref:Kinetochore protein Spc24 n=1 Tax=Linum trigynum TaxID=586398 RepID=A0AAV2DZ92_9ROSI
MADLLGGTNLDKLMSFSDDLVAVLKKQTSIHSLAQCLDESKALHTFSEAEFDEAHTQLEDYERKIEECKRKTQKAKLEVRDEAEIDLLQKELEAELEKELINNQISDLEQRRGSVDEQIQLRKKLDREESRAQKKLSMYASVTNIIPDLGDRSNISGHIVDLDKRMVEKFEFNPAESTPFETCESIWKLINHR